MEQEGKLCIRCGAVKPLDDFYRDRSRADGLKPYCIKCVEDYVPKKKKRKLKGTSKQCVGCSRMLPSECFLPGPGGLTDDCRTCRSYRNGYPNEDEIVNHEGMMEVVFSLAYMRLMETYSYSPLGLLEEHRGEFEQIVYQMMEREGLLGKWKPPIWLNETLVSSIF